MTFSDLPEDAANLVSDRRVEDEGALLAAQHLQNNDLHGVGGYSSDPLQEEAGPSDQQHAHRFWNREGLHQGLVEFLQERLYFRLCHSNVCFFYPLSLSR